MHIIKLFLVFSLMFAGLVIMIRGAYFVVKFGDDNPELNRKYWRLMVFGQLHIMAAGGLYAIFKFA